MTRTSRAVLLGACAALLAALVMASGAEARSGGKPLIRSPHSGRVLGARPVVLKVRAGNGAKVFRVQLNGKPIAKHFSKANKKRIRKLRVTPSYGLRHGKNRLHVRVRPAHGHKKSEWSRFRIRRNRPLAAAGFPIKANAGDLVYLNSGRSRSHLNGASGALKKGTSKLSHHWKVVGAPPGAPPGAASMDGADTKTPLLRTTVAGTYRVKLTVTAKDGAKGTDTLPVKAANPPFMSVDTMTEASGDKPGIKVGDQPTQYADDSVPNPWWQVVVYDRKTMVPSKLVPVSNKTYSCNRASNGFCDDSELQKDLGKLNDTQLVIASNHMSDPKWVAPGYTSFHKIGAQDYGAENIPSGVASYSAIGIPDTNPGEGDWHLDRAKGSGGRMEGSLIIDNKGWYSYLPPRESFDTQVYGSDQSQNVMEVAGKKFTVPLSLDANQNGQGGFQVTVLDRQHLADGAQTYWFPTGLQDFDSGEPGRLDAMSARLEQANDGDNIVIIASRGNPATQTGREDQQQNVNNSVKRLAGAIAALGGTRTDAFQALSPGVTKSGASYTLIGHSKAGTGRGVETQGTSTTPAKALNSVALSGTFERGHDYGFEVGDSAPSQIQNPSDPPVHDAGEMLNDTLLQSPTPWPDQSDGGCKASPGRIDPSALDNAGCEAAIAYFGDQLFAHHDPRYDYWHSGNSDGDWLLKQSQVKLLPYVANQGFSKDDFQWAKTEVNQEIVWVRAAGTLTQKLAQPFAKGALESWGALNKITQDIASSVQVPKENKVTAVAFALFDGAREAATELPEPVGIGFGIANTIYNTVLEIATITVDGTESADEPFSVKAGDVGSELVTRLSAAQDTLTGSVAGAIVADYGKLKTVGVCSQGLAACPEDPRAWLFDADDQRGAATALQYGSQLSDYAALVPAQWELWRLGEGCSGSTDYTCWETDFQGNGFGSQVFLGHVCPFLNEPHSAKMIRPFYRDIPRYRNNAGFGSNPVDVWDVYALGKLEDPGGTKPFKMNYPSDFMARVFAPIDPAGNIDRGGLGAQPERFFLGNMKPKLMGSGGQQFPYNASNVQWFGKHTDCTEQP